MDRDCADLADYERSIAEAAELAASVSEPLVTVEEVTVEEGRALFDDAARDMLGVSGPEFLRRYDNNDIPIEWPGHKVCWLEILIPFGR